MNTPVGWRAWKGQAKLAVESDQMLAARVHRLLKTTNWRAISMRIKALFHSRCEITIEFTYGGSGLVRLAVLRDRRCFVIWLALGTESIPRMERRTWASCLIRSMYVASISFSSNLANLEDRDSTANTSIPKVLDHCFRETSQYGPPYLVMEYLPGSPASSLSLSTEQQRLVLQQLAFKMAELYHQTPFSAIGQISRNPDHFGDFWVGPDPETGEGPFYKASDYYKAVSKHRFGKYIDEVLESNLAAADTPGMHLPLLFEYLMPAMSHDWYSEGPFGIWNTDPRLLDHTMLDAQLNFVGW